MPIRKNKIISTIWPACWDEKILKKLLPNIDMCRINLSHCKSYADAKVIVDKIRKVDENKPIFLDTKWPEIRTKITQDLLVKTGDSIMICHPDKKVADALYIDYDLSDIPVGTKINLMERKVEIKVTSKKWDTLTGKVTSWWSIWVNKSVCFEWYTPKLPILTKSDIDCLTHAIQDGIYTFAISFVNDDKDIDTVKKIWWKDASLVKIISKIETPLGVKNIKKIIEKTDGVMIARWDLGNSIPLEQLPKAQSDICKIANDIGKPVILATQVLQSMSENPIPSRAELDEIAFNIKYWVDCFMTSDETATGKFPLQTIERLNKIIYSNQDDKVAMFYRSDDDFQQISDIMIYATVRLMKKFDFKVIVCPTESSATPSKIASQKPNQTIIWLTTNLQSYHFMHLMYGVYPVLVKKEFSDDNIKKSSKEISKKLFSNIKWSDKICIIQSSLQQNQTNKTNSIHMYRYDEL